MKKTYIIIALVVAVAIWISVKSYGDTDVPDAEVKGFSSQEFKLSFEYPALYHLEQKNINNTHRVHEQIMLTEDTEENRLVREGQAPGREGPTAITIDIYQNNLDNQSARSFIIGSSDSNYKLGDGNISTTTRGGLMGFEYSWSGLYEGRSFVVSRPDYIYMFSVTRLDPGDRILKDFEEVMKSVVIQD
jgi:hypothetical protein